MKNLNIDGLFDFSDLEPSTQNHLRRVYSLLSSGIAIAIFCFILAQYFPSFGIFFMGLGVLALIADIILICMNRRSRVGQMVGYTSLYGYASSVGGSFGTYLNNVDPNSRMDIYRYMMSALVSVLIIFIMFSVFALLTSNRSGVYLLVVFSSLILSILSCFMWGYASIFSTIAWSLLIVTDTPDKKRVDCSLDLDSFKYKIKIDHHPIVDEFGNLVLVDDTASSACQLILEFVFANRIMLNTSIAEKLFWGIVSDTGRFMHGYTSSRTLELVTRMIEEVNLDFTSLYEPLYMRPLAEVRFQGYIYDNMTVTDNGVAYIKIDDDMLKKYNVDSASAGNIIQELKFVDELWIWVFLTEDKKSNLIRANIRSRGPAINDIASIFGGGGHRLASGARLTSWSQADDLIDELNKLAGRYIEETRE